LKARGFLIQEARDNFHFSLCRTGDQVRRRCPACRQGCTMFGCFFSVYIFRL